jgi:hypothetical protein
MTITELIAVFRAVGGTLRVNPDGESFHVEGPSRIWPLAKALIDRSGETMEVLRAGEPPSASELIAAWKALPESERAEFGEHGLAEFDDFTVREAKRLIQSAHRRGACPQLADARALIGLWNSAPSAVRAEFPDGVLDFELWGDEVAHRLIECAAKSFTGNTGQEER